MKKLTVFILITLFCTNAFNQVKKQTIGIEIAPTIRSLISDNLFTNNVISDLGFSAGLNYQYRITNLFSVKTGITYDKKGADDDIAYYDEEEHYLGTTHMTINLNYLVVPLMVSLSDKKNHFNLSSGPYIGYLVRYIEKTSAFGSHPERETNLTRDAEHIDFGWVLGVGYNFHIGEKIGMEIGIRDDLGITNLSKNPLHLRTNSLGLRFGLKYDLN